MNLEPSPGCDSTRICPPWRCTISCAIARASWMRTPAFSPSEARAAFRSSSRIAAGCATAREPNPVRQTQNMTARAPRQNRSPGIIPAKRKRGANGVQRWAAVEARANALEPHRISRGDRNLSAGHRTRREARAPRHGRARRNWHWDRPRRNQPMGAGPRSIRAHLRRCRVSSCLALITHQTSVRR